MKDTNRSVVSCASLITMIAIVAMLFIESSFPNFEIKTMLIGILVGIEGERIWTKVRQAFKVKSKNRAR